jgi:hypothetical protein
VHHGLIVRREEEILRVWERFGLSGLAVERLDTEVMGSLMTDGCYQPKQLVKRFRREASWQAL